MAIWCEELTIWKDPGIEKDWRRKEKGMTEDEMVGWHHQLNGHGFGWTLGVGDGQGGLVHCSSWSSKEFSWGTELKPHLFFIRHIIVFLYLWIPVGTSALGWGDYFKQQKWKCQSLQSCPTLCNWRTVAHQAFLSIGFSRQGYCSGLLFPPLGDLPDPGI